MTEMFYLFLDCFRKKYFQFRGRANNKEYISFRLFYLLLESFIITIIEVVKDDIITIVVSCCYLIFLMYTIIPLITVTIRRLHDFNINGFFGIIDIPILIFLHFKGYNVTAIIISLFITFVLFFIKGTPGSNKYGLPTVD